MEEKELNVPNTDSSQNEDLDIVADANANAEAVENTEANSETESTTLSDAEKLAQAELEIAELKDKLLRQAADFANFRKHSINTQAELIVSGGKKVIEAFLPILDDMERAAANMTETTELETLREGLQLVFQKMIRTLEQQGLKKMETATADFDTDFHEAVALFPVEEAERKNKIIDCVQTGYLLNDKVLRHAKVVVGQ